MPPLTFKKVINTAVKRSRRWHTSDGVNDWSALEWAGAMAGEAGEACNAAKKLKRIEGRIKNINTEKGRSLKTLAKAKKQILKEVADTILYAVLVAERVEGDLEKEIIEVFNQKSREYGFPERL